MSDEGKTLQIEGFCEGIMLKDSGWQEFHINIGKQYPVKLSSKYEDVQAMVAAAGKQPAVWTYTERNGNPNPHRPGEFYKNRWLTNVEVGGKPDPSMAQQTRMDVSPAASSSGHPSSEGRDQSIERQVLIKAVFDSGHEWVRSLDQEGTFTLLTELDDWMGRKRAGTVAPAPVVESPPVIVAEQQAAAAKEEEDDIPF